MKPATPLPYWYAATTVSAMRADAYAVGSGNEEIVCGTNRQDAAYIAHACNHYPALVDMIQRLTHPAADELDVDDAINLLRALGEA